MIAMIIGINAMGAMTGMSATATGAAIVTIGMTDITIAIIGALIATVIGVIAEAMTEKESTTTINVTKQGADDCALLCGFLRSRSSRLANIRPPQVTSRLLNHQDSAMKTAGYSVTAKLKKIFFTDKVPRSFIRFPASASRIENLSKLR
jgi:hypothetical protein